MKLYTHTVPYELHHKFVRPVLEWEQVLKQVDTFCDVHIHETVNKRFANCFIEINDNINIHIHTIPITH